MQLKCFNMIKKKNLNRKRKESKKPEEKLCVHLNNKCTSVSAQGEPENDFHLYV